MDLAKIFQFNKIHSIYRDSKQWSLEAYLEAVVGDYYMRGKPDCKIQLAYYMENMDGYERPLPLSDDKIVAVISEKYGAAVVSAEFKDKFMEDTKEYCFSYWIVNCLTEENCCCSDTKLINSLFGSVHWIDDDFLNDETIEFDYDSFDMIDSGVDYLNPKHFSIINFAKKVFWL